MGVSVMEETFDALRRFKNIPLFAFNWDVYKWVWLDGMEGRKQARHDSRRNEYNYVRYGELLKQATEVWVPSECTGRRTTQWYGLTNWYTILSSVPYWDYHNVTDKGYVYCALREIPDPKWDILEKACRELKITLVMTKHEVPYEEYQRTLAQSSLLVSHCYELSTGGLSLLEGYYLGKPCLLSNSEWHGGRDYLGSRGQYFQWDDYDHFKFMLNMMYTHRRDYRESLADGQEWIVGNFSDEVMVTKMLRRIERIK